MKDNFKLNNFDLIRIFAATQVLLIHSFIHTEVPFPQWFKLLAPFPGVPIFFVTSGFLISASLERNNHLPNYFRNRILRIYPALWICIIITVLTIFAVAKINFFHWDGLKWFISQNLGFIYTPNFLQNWGFGSYNGALWTIPVELQFYIMLPVIYQLTSYCLKTESQKTAVVFALCILFTFIAYYILAYHSNNNLKFETKIQKLLRYSFISHFYLFMSGVLLQRLNAYRSKIINGKGLFWVTTYLAFTYYAPVNYLTQILGNVFLGVCTISVAYTLPGIASKILRGNDISYGVYIYHGLVLGVIVQLNLLHSQYIVLLIFLTTYLLAFFSWRLIEKPSIQKKDQHLQAPAT